MDLVIIETLTASLDFEREGYTDKILGIIKIPKGDIVIEDRFYFEDFFHIKNDLSIDTPYNFASEIASSYNLALDMESSVYLMDLNFNVKNHSDWIEVFTVFFSIHLLKSQLNKKMYNLQSGFNINYTSQGFEEGDPQTRTMKFDLKTPLKFLKFFNSKSTIEIDDNMYKVNVSIRSVESLLDLIVSLEVCKNDHS